MLFARRAGSSSFPRFVHREWLALMPGVDPLDEEAEAQERQLEHDVKEHADKEL